MLILFISVVWSIVPKSFLRYLPILIQRVALNIRLTLLIYNGQLQDSFQYFQYFDLLEFSSLRQDGHPNTEILLPIDKPFYLQRFTSECQQVLGMRVQQEFIFFDDEDSANKDKCGGSHPYADSGCDHGNVRLYFCYYSPKPNQTEILIPSIVGWSRHGHVYI